MEAEVVSKLAATSAGRLEEAEADDEEVEEKAEGEDASVTESTFSARASRERRLITNLKTTREN